MSRAENATLPAGTTTTSRTTGGMRRLLGSELRLVFGRRRNAVLLVGLALVPILLGLVVFLAQDSVVGSQGPGFVGRITGNGLFLVVAALFVCLPFLLPLTIGIVAGDTIAGEAATGTLRYLVTLPVRRTRLLLVKAAVALCFAAAAVAVIALTGLVTGWLLFGISDLVLLSGDTIASGAGLLRVLGVATYVAMSMSGLVVVGVLLSTLTETPVAAMAGTVTVAVVSAVLDSLPQLSAIHPGLLTHHWFDFAEFLRLDVDPAALAPGLVVQAVWVVIAGTIAWSRFTTADISS
ncbi:ABC transporter permease [Ruania halotolerans]|uniref:ABC transporter permease n=1 Tax=Ruania halotolerans TaxID=2897773 RepID=UPI001E585817|nr:ABC transporter permease [Ruania halotolerans]UFU07082.1 ABC transporter permease [Ruania halotolerans]